MGNLSPMFQPMVQQPIQPPKSDPGQVKDMNDAVDTSQVFIGSSQDKATAWRMRRGKGQSPSAANLGKGAISFNDTASGPNLPSSIGA